MNNNTFVDVLKSGNFIGNVYSVFELMKLGNYCFINYEPEKDKIQCMCGKKIKNKKINKSSHCSSDGHTSYFFKWISENEELYLMNEKEVREYFNLIIIDSINGEQFKKMGKSLAILENSWLNIINYITGEFAIFVSWL